jgi:hypothetical protein
VIKFSFCWTARAGAEMSLNRLVAITEDLGTIADVPLFPTSDCYGVLAEAIRFPGHEKEQGSDKHE